MIDIASLPKMSREEMIKLAARLAVATGDLNTKLIRQEIDIINATSLEMTVEQSREEVYR